MADPWVIEPLDLTLRLVVSLLLGGVIGFERELNRHAAGLRTNILVCLGSTLIMLLSMYGFRSFIHEPNVNVDPARLAAQVISGIGFLGAGTIMQKGLSVKGLTTAATLWVMAAIGLAVGAGFFYPAIITCGLVFLSLRILNKIEHRYFTSGRSHLLRVYMSQGSKSLDDLQVLLDHKEVRIRNMSVENQDGSGIQKVTVTFVPPKGLTSFALVQKINKIPHVTAVKVEG